MGVGLGMGVVHAQEQGVQAPVEGQPETAIRQFDVDARLAAEALNEFARQADITLVFSSDVVAGEVTSSIKGSYSTNQALDLLLSDTDLSYSFVGASTIAINRRAAQVAAGTDAQSPTLGTVTVTGTRIRGATTPSPLITIDKDSIRENGYGDLGDAIRNLPQNFSGGQNPGVALGASLSGVANQNLTSGSALNLRGLGADATLTLLNGRRLSYSGFTNAIDVSVVPIGALERIEIVTDGASAIYGSDAVAGVANIITRRDFNGVRADYRYGTATDGGGEEHRYGLTAGTTWEGGGFIVSYEQSDTDAIYAHDRAYLDYLQGENTLMPARAQKTLFASGYQDIGDVATFSIDVVRMQRDSLMEVTQPPMFLQYDAETDSTVFAPSLEFYLPRDWSISLGGSLARDETDAYNRYYTLQGVHMQDSGACYCNEARAVEVGAEGPVFKLPAGEVRTAVGMGWRENDFENRSHTSTALIEGKRDSRYVFGEVNVPLVAPGQVSGAHRLDFTAAFRFEDYGDMGSVTTPKLGLVYQPSASVTLKGSWGESYKAPNLIQQYQDAIVHLRPAALQGATGYPADATILAISGGNQDLKPERADTWTASLLFHPQSIPGLQLELGIFDVDYTDRVMMPVSNMSATFRDPIYADFIVLDPSDALQMELIDSADRPLINATGTPYDPSNVIGIVYNTYTNVARQRVRGVDLSGSYKFELAGGRLMLRGSGSWLQSKQRNSPAADEFTTTGRIFNPSKFHGRAGAVWYRGNFMLASYVNHVSSVTDNLHAVEVDTGSFTTVDANARYTIGGGGLLEGIELGLSAQNLFNREPPQTEPLFDFIVNYDSTNYSAIGRYVRFTISKHW